MAVEVQGKARKIGLREIRALEPNTQIFDAGAGAVTGFGARRRAGSVVSYFCMYRAEGVRLRLYTIGQHGSPWTPDTAREKALAVLADVKLRGADPSADKRSRREGQTVAELCDAYLADCEAGRLLTRRGAAKKASTLLSDRGRIEHVKALLGRMKVSAVTRLDVEAAMHAIAEGKTAAKAPTGKKRGLSNRRGGAGVARRTVGMLGAIFGYAVDRGMRPDNPVRGVRRTADGAKDRRLSDAEYEALGAALRRASEVGIWPPAIAATWCLAISGWRAGEAIGLRWVEVDLPGRTATLPTKTGKSVRPLSNGACDVLRSLPRSGDLVFPASRGAGRMTGYRSLFDRIAAMGGLPVAGRAMTPVPPGTKAAATKRGKIVTKPVAAGDLITPHTLRHSLASIAADLGYSEFAIAGLLGHLLHSVTSKYAHTADAVLLAAADAVENETAWRMGEPRIRNVSH
jgi:integrase